MVAPPFFAADAQLLVDALKLAVAIQQQNGEGQAARVVAGALIVAAVVAVANGWGKAA